MVSCNQMIISGNLYWSIIYLRHIFKYKIKCSTNPRVCFISTQTELYAIKVSENLFADLCSKLTLVDVQDVAFSQLFLAAVIRTWQTQDIYLILLQNSLNLTEVQALNLTESRVLDLVEVGFLNLTKDGYLNLTKVGSPIRKKINVIYKSTILKTAVRTTESAIVESVTVKISYR